MPIVKSVSADRPAPLEENERVLGAASILIVPGWNGSGPGHWQTLWGQENPRFRRVEQRNWVTPVRFDWMEQIDVDVQEAERPVFLVAHSLGCLAVAHWAAAFHGSRDIAGALLVAPPWLTAGKCPRELVDFLPMPTRRLPFSSLLVASENDPYLPLQRAVRWAAAWGARLVNVGRRGHINVASGHGPWSGGEDLLRGFVAEILGLESY